MPNPSAEAIAALKEAGLYRSNKTLQQRKGHQAVLQGRPVTLFCSNDYLGLSQHPDVSAAMQKGVEQWGAGSGAAHLISGHCQPHEELEQAFADFMGYEAALLFSTGYMANLAAVTTFAGRHDTVLQDKLNHASLLDAAKLAGAKLARYRHADTDHAKSKLPAALMASDGVFSMDGDIAPLPALAAAAQQAKTPLLIDDAHGFGVLGPQGRGSVAAAGLSSREVPLLMCTLGKAAGTFGAVLLGSRADVELCKNSARSYIYTTALPPALMAASLASLKLIQQGDALRERLQANIHQFRQGAAQLGLALMPSETAIQPVLMPGNEGVLAASQALLGKGFLVTAIRSPTVAKGSERLRITLSADHNADDINRLLQALETL